MVLLEDFGALIGLGLALGGVSLTLATGDGRWDAVGSGAIAAAIAAAEVRIRAAVSRRVRRGPRPSARRRRAARAAASRG